MSKKHTTPTPEVQEETPVEIVIDTTPQVEEPAEIVEIKATIAAEKAAKAPVADVPLTVTRPASAARMKALAAGIVLVNGGSETKTGGRIVHTLTTDTLGLDSVTELLTLVKSL